MSRRNGTFTILCAPSDLPADVTHAWARDDTTGCPGSCPVNNICWSQCGLSKSFTFRGAFRYLRLLSLVYMYQKMDMTVPRVFKETVKSFAHKKCLVHEDRSWTFQDLEDYSNRVANYLIREGYKPGDCIALFMHNKPVCTKSCDLCLIG